MKKNKAEGKTCQLRNVFVSADQGFSLVELIIVIAIMAILAAAIAPALIRYIDKCRKADDISAAESIMKGADAALAEEEAYVLIYEAFKNGTNNITSDANGFYSNDDCWIAYAYPGQPFVICDNYQGADGATEFIDALNSNLNGHVAPEMRYTKNVLEKGARTGHKPQFWVLAFNGKDGFEVWEGYGTPGTTINELSQLVPESKDYTRQY